ncbi:MAG TPA: SDR family NAD(P)-dependent oxidoreductase [Planctomycetaceae bacterium]
MKRSHRYAVVTGAGGGIGRAICLELAREGWHVAAADIDPDAAAETARLVGEAGGVGRAARLDVRDAAGWTRLRDGLQTDWPALDLLVNNAGVTAAGLFERTAAETWDWVQEINLGGAVLGCRALLPWLRATPKLAADARRAYVMNMASAAGVLAGPRQSAYNVSKAALVALSETLHHELKPHDVGVTAVCPWYLPTGLIKGGRFDRATERGYVTRLTKGSNLTPEAVARAALRATFRGQAVCVVGRRARALHLLKRLAPTTYAWLVGRLYDPQGLLRLEPIRPVATDDRAARAA